VFQISEHLGQPVFTLPLPPDFGFVAGFDLARFFRQWERFSFSWWRVALDHAGAFIPVNLGVFAGAGYGDEFVRGVGASVLHLTSLARASPTRSP